MSKKRIAIYCPTCDVVSITPAQICCISNRSITSNLMDSTKRNRMLFRSKAEGIGWGNKYSATTTTTKSEAIFYLHRDFVVKGAHIRKVQNLGKKLLAKDAETLTCVFLTSIYYFQSNPTSEILMSI